MRRATNPRLVTPASDETDSTGGHRPRARLIIGTAVALALLTVTFGGGWTLADSFRSPAQQAAAATAPAPGAVTATVDRGALEQTVGLTAVVARQDQQQVPIQAVASPSVVTKQPLKSGDQIKPATVILEIDGRPVFAVPGAFPFYRDLSTGESGPDVLQFQEGLKAAGYAVNPNGVFGPSTDAAVRRMYKSAGYSLAASDSAVADPGTAAATTGSTGTTTGSTGTTTGSTGATAPSVVLVPRSELITLASLPAFIVSTPAVGTTLGATSQILVEEGDIVATADVASDVAAQMKTGMTGVLTGPDGQKVNVALGSVGSDATDQTNSDAGSSPDTADGAADPSAATDPNASAAPSDSTSVVLLSVGNPFPTTWLRSTLRAQITVQIASKDSLIVPSIAVITGGTDSARVLKELPDGNFTSIPVKETAQLSGQSAISPENPSDLAAGDQVRVK